MVGIQSGIFRLKDIDLEQNFYLVPSQDIVYLNPRIIKTNYINNLEG